MSEKIFFFHFQLGETKFPVQPSNEPKVVVPRIPFNSGIKTEPTKLIPISTAVSHDNKQQEPKTTASIRLPSSESGNPSTERTQRPTIRPTVSANSNAGHVSGPEYDTKISYRQNQQSTIGTNVRPTSHPTSSSLFKDSIKIDGPSTAKTPSNTLQLQNLNSPDTSEGPGQSDYTEDLLPPFRTTVPVNSFGPGNDFNIINSYANLNPQGRTTTTQSGFFFHFTCVYNNSEK